MNEEDLIELIGKCKRIAITATITALITGWICGSIVTYIFLIS